MIGFIVPVKSKQLSSDWDAFSKLVERTLNSICGQKDQNFQVIVACHELPSFKIDHPQVHFTQVDFDPPTIKNEDWEKDRQLKEGDKAQKILAGFEYAKKHFSIDYFMVVDSDDCIHNGISKYVNSKLDKNIPGWYVSQGYFYREGKNMAWKIRSNFNLRCGTCIIIKSEFFEELIQTEPYIYYIHEKRSLSNGNELIAYPYAASIYSMANGENHYMSPKKMMAMVNQTKFFTYNHIKSVFSKLTRYSPRRIGKRFKKTYNFYPIS